MAIEFKGDTAKRILEALLAAFTDKSELDQMVVIVLENPLNHYADVSKNLPGVVFELCRKAFADGDLDTLLIGAHREKPGNPTLRKLHDDFFVPAVAPIITESTLGANGIYQRCWLGGEVVFLDRSGFRDHLKEIEDFDLKRVVVVTGEPKSGKSYTAELVKYVARQQGHETVSVDLRNIPRNRNPVAALASEIAGNFDPKSLASSGPVPGTESTARWIYQPLILWTTGWMRETNRKWWLVIDGFDREIVEKDVYDFLTFLGEKIEEDFPPCRLVLLGYDQPVPPEWKGRSRLDSIEPLTEGYLVEFFERLYEENGVPVDSGMVNSLAGKLFTQYQDRLAAGKPIPGTEEEENIDPYAFLNRKLSGVLKKIIEAKEGGG